MCPWDEEALEYIDGGGGLISAPPVGGVTWDPVNGLGAGITLSNGNLTATNTNITTAYCQSTTADGNTGKKYVEVTFSGAAIGANTWLCALVRTNASYPTGYVIGQSSAFWTVNGSASSVTSVPTASGDVLGIAVDFDNGRIWNRSTTQTVWNANGSADPATNIGGADISAAQDGHAFFFQINLGDHIGQVGTVNFGASAFSFTPPAGFANW
jgi:hypothetical protein